MKTNSGRAKNYNYIGGSGLLLIDTNLSFLTKIGGGGGGERAVIHSTPVKILV